MTTETDVLRTLLAEPYQADLRLIAADWLEDRGDPRGELLRLTQELTQAITVPNRAVKEARLQALLAEGVCPFVPTFTNSIGMKLALIPAGTFLMGSPKSEAERAENEGPQHEVIITRPFFLGSYPVTQHEYRTVLRRSPSYFKKAQGGGPNHPVENVSWEDAVEFCQRLSKREQQQGFLYRLPTEAEWEYACRAGTVSAFAFGNALTSTQANFDGNYPYGGAAKGPYLQRTSKVGSYQPNAFGLCDMYGNVCEWCQDWYRVDYYETSPKTDPQGPPEPAPCRVLRGGCWYDFGRSCRSAYRIMYWSNNSRHQECGFRVAAVQSSH